VNHLGNVLAVITDRHKGIETTADVYSDKYLPDVIVAQDYDPGGMILPGREWVATAENYKFGFNGKENTDEVYGEGNAVDFGARIYDVRLERWLSVDPLFKDYPSLSPFVYSANSPIWLTDNDGRKVTAYDTPSKELVLSTINYMFGSGFVEKNGFLFENNVLVHNGNTPTGFSKEQEVMYQYFMDLLVNSKTEVSIRANRNSIGYTGMDGEVELAFVSSTAAATTFGLKPFTIIEKNENNVPKVVNSRDYQSITMIPTQTMKNGTGVATEDGNISAVPVEYLTIHEFGHDMINVIMNEFGGKYNGINFTILTQEEQNDFSIRLSNTLNKDKGMSQETGANQHGRKDGKLPVSKPTPLTK